jgi:hypothetical protein
LCRFGHAGNPPPRQRRLILGVGFNPRDPGQNPRVASATLEHIGIEALAPVRGLKWIEIPG